MTDARRAALLAALGSCVRSGLGGVWLRGRLPAGPAVWAANHHSWWDPFIALDLCRQARRRAVVLMDGDNLRRYGFARRLGVIGTDELRAGLAAVRAGAVLVLYPETELRAAGPPGGFAPGAAWFAQQAPARLCSAAVRVTLRGEQFPEAYIVLAEVDRTGTREAVTRRLHDQLDRDLADLDRLSAGSDPRQPLPGFRPVLRGRRSWDRRLDGAVSRLPWPRR